MVTTKDLTREALTRCMETYEGVICPYADDLDGDMAEAIDFFLESAAGQFTIDLDGIWYEEGSKMI